VLEWKNLYIPAALKTIDIPSLYLLNRFLSMDNLTPDNIIKVNIWSTEQIDWDYFDKVYDDFFGKPYPSMTVAYVNALGLEEIKLEIEIWAAK